MDEARLDAIERRLARLERLLRVEAPPAPAPPPAVHPPAAPPPPAPPENVWAKDIDLEEVFGGRVLAWLGSSAVVRVGTKHKPKPKKTTTTTSTTTTTTSTTTTTTPKKKRLPQP